MPMTNNRRIIYSLRVRIELQQRGFEPILEMINPGNPKFNCWVYEQTPEFKAAVDEVIGGEYYGTNQ